MVTLNLKFIVLGHDLPVSLKEVAASRNLPKDLRRVVATKIGQGATKEATVAEVALLEYSQMGRYDRWL